MQRDIKLVWFRRWFVLAVRNAVHRHRWHEDVLFDEAKKSISMQRSIITGVLEPILEETVFRGFLMVSLAMWFSTPVCVLITAVVFAFAHLTPEEFPQLFVLGVALGFSYSQTRNLLTPITIHAAWNSGVILLLTVLQLQGYDIKELLQAS